MSTHDESGLAGRGPLAAASATAAPPTSGGAGSPDDAGSLALRAGLAEIAAGAQGRDQADAPEFPDDAFRALRRMGILAFNAFSGRARPPAAEELSLVRSVAAADGSVGRIFDGHLNAVERLAVQAPAARREAELEAVRSGAVLAGVWGGDPMGEEGVPATVLGAPPDEVLRGVKTFCSGAGGLDRAAVLARAEHGGPPLLVWVDAGDLGHVEIDRNWYKARGLRASVSHRVIFHDAPVLVRLGPAGGIAAQPWFGRDALRTAASWAGMADTAVCAALASLAERRDRGQLEALAAGRMLTAQRTIDIWLHQGAAAMDRADADLGSIALHGRAAIAASCRELLDEAARACGSRPFATAQALDRARRDLELFLLQHRLDPLLAREGARVLDAMANPPTEKGPER